MPEDKHYNPYTKYGRRKSREQAARNIQNYTPDEKAEYDKSYAGCQVMVVVGFIVVCILIAVIAGPDALIEWLK